MNSLSFWTTGESYTNLVRGFVKEGNLDKASKLTDPLSKEIKNKIFTGKMCFEGDTRKGDLKVIECDEPIDLDIIFWNIIKNNIFVEDKTSLNNWNKEIKQFIKNLSVDDPERYDNFKYYAIHIKKFHFQDWVNLYIKSLKERLCDLIIDSIDKKGNPYATSGVILNTGRIIFSEYNEHTYIVPILNELGYKGDRWGDGTSDMMFFSSHEMNGDTWFQLANENRDNLVFSKELLNTLFKYRNVLDPGFRRNSITDVIREHYIREGNLGTKYGNLLFLKDFYDVKLPVLNPTKGKICVRSSLKTQYAGVLDSWFDIDIKDVEDFKKTIKDQFESLPERFKKHNECFAFTQEYIVGERGTVNYINNNFQTSLEEGNKLKESTLELSKDLNQDIQLEFVVSLNMIYVVELKTFKKTELLKNDWYGGWEKDYDLIVKGKGYSEGVYEGTIGKTILLLDEEVVNLEDLEGVKAVIMRKDLTFSHTLALTRHLKIVSVYDIGDKELKGEVTVNGNLGIIYKKKGRD